MRGFRYYGTGGQQHRASASPRRAVEEPPIEYLNTRTRVAILFVLAFTFGVAVLITFAVFA